MDIQKQTEIELKRLNDEYDLSELAENDRRQLEELASALAQATFFSELLDDESQNDPVDVRRLKDIQSMLAGIRRDVSIIQGDLKIDRKSREKKTESVPEYVRDIKERALVFIEQRMSYIYCPKCKFLVANIWLYNYNMGSKFKFICPQCEHDFIVPDFSLVDRKNISEAVVPKKQ